MSAEIRTLKDGTTEVYPRTKAKAVYLESGGNVEVALKNAASITATYPVAAGTSVSLLDVVDISDAGEVINGTTAISVDAQQTIVPSTISRTRICALTSDSSVVAYANGDTGSLAICSNSDGAISSTQGEIYLGTQFELYKLSETAFILSYISNGALRARVGSTQDGTISLGAERSSNALGLGTIVVVDDTHFLEFGSNGMGLAYGVYEISGDTISHINSGSLSTSYDPSIISAVMLHDGTHVCLCFADTKHSDFLFAAVSTLDGYDVLSIGDCETVRAGATTNVSCIPFGEGDAIVSYGGSLATSRRMTYLSVTGDSVTTDGFIGLGETSDEYDGLALLDVGGNIVSMLSSYISVYSYSNGNFHLLDSVDIGSIGKPSADVVDSTGMVLAYVDDSSNGSLVLAKILNAGSTAIALSAGTTGDDIDVIYSGVAVVDQINVGDIVRGPFGGVYGVGIVDTVLQVFPKQEMEYIDDNVLPAVTSSDNDKFLRVVDGAWAVVSVPSAEGASF